MRQYLFLGFLFLFAPAALACSCATPTNDIANDDVVFGGVVTAVRDRFGFEEDVQVHFTVEQPYKGIFSQKVTVYTASTEASCGYPFQEGERYLVRAKEENRQLVTSLCSGNQVVEEYPSLALRRLAPTPQQSSRLVVSTIALIIATFVACAIVWRYARQPQQSQKSSRKQK